MSLHWTDLLASLYSWICTFPPALVLRSSLPTASIGAWTLIIDENNSVMSLDHCWLSFKLIVFMLKVNFHTYSKGTHNYFTSLRGRSPGERGDLGDRPVTPLGKLSHHDIPAFWAELMSWVHQTRLHFDQRPTLIWQHWFDSRHCFASKSSKDFTKLFVTSNGRRSRPMAILGQSWLNITASFADLCDICLGVFNWPNSGNYKNKRNDIQIFLSRQI